MSLLSLLWLSLLMTSCVKTEVINATEEHEAVVEKRRKPEKPLSDKPEQTDTTRVPITFNPSVEDWDDIEENL